jgi:SAM-dependent methyltransferase
MTGPMTEPMTMGSPPDLVAELIRYAGDRTSLSDELHLAAQGPVERAQLDRGRANWLRALDLPPDAVVLELGAGYGSHTRFLGERVARVDAVEPDEVRAAAVAARAEDLPGVRVIPLDDAGNGYDLVVASDPFAADLEVARARLRPGGTLCLAVGNPLGVRRLAGGQGTGFSLPHWRKLLAEAGFAEPRVLGCLPDHHLARMVFAEELLTSEPRLATEIPRLPAAERKLWGELVEGGLAAGTANGFVLLATTGEPSTLWPEDRLASYFNTDRAARWCTRGDVYPGEVRRTPLTESAESGGVAVRAWTDPIVDAATLPDLLLDQPWRAEELLTSWRDLVRRRADELGPALWDLIPQNVLVTADDEPHAIDLEWERAGTTEREVIERGVLLLADRLATEGWSGASEHSSVRLLASWLGVLAGCPVGFTEEAADREAWFQAVRVTGTTEGEAHAAEHGATRASWRRRLADEVTGPLPVRARFTGRELDELVAVTMARIDRTIAEGDRMYGGQDGQYFGIGESALRSCLHALHGAGRPLPRRVLDFGCGHGRVLRTLRAAFPDAELLACDIDPEAVEFCRATFGARPVAGSENLPETRQVTGIDLLWAGSVLTHLDLPGWDALLRYCARALAPGGIALLTTHGRRVARNLEHGIHDGYGLDAEGERTVLDGYRDVGFGYADYPGQRGYGISLSSPSRAIGRALAQPGLRLAGYDEAGWYGHQDVLVLVRDGNELGAGQVEVQ